MDRIICKHCGTELAPELASVSNRPPCPSCGGKGVIIEVSMVATIDVSSCFQSTLIPGKQEQDWRSRWDFFQSETSQIFLSQSGPTSADAIHMLSNRFRALLVTGYHIKDALIDAEPPISTPRAEIEKAINDDPRLALLADLANGYKHPKRNGRLRSGSPSSIIEISGEDSPDGHGWRLKVKIAHGDNVLDGFSVAQSAITAWSEKFSDWNLP